jgi:hypothetical protein
MKKLFIAFLVSLLSFSGQSFATCTGGGVCGRGDVPVNFTYNGVNNVITLTFSLSDLQTYQPSAVSDFVNQQYYVFDNDYSFPNDWNTQLLQYGYLSVGISYGHRLGDPPSYYGLTIKAGVQNTIYIDGDNVTVTFDLNQPSNRPANGNNTAAVNSQNYISTYPNPATSILNINFPKSENSAILLMDIAGRIVDRRDVSNLTSTVFNVAGYPKGVYLYKVITNGKIDAGRFIVQ